MYLAGNAPQAPASNGVLGIPLAVPEIAGSTIATTVTVIPDSEPTRRSTSSS